MNGFQSDAEESFRALLAKYGFVWVWKKKKYQEERHLKLPHYFLFIINFRNGEQLIFWRI